MTVPAFALDQLNSEQRNAVCATEGPVLVLAGAGSGKTRVLTYRIAYLIREVGVPPWEILAVTFTKKAANEMRERVSKLLGHNDPLWIGTFHSTFSKILRREAQAIGYTSNFVIYDSDDQVRLIKMVMEFLEIPVSKFNPKSVAGAISKAKNSLQPAAGCFSASNSPFEAALSRIYPEYQKRIRENQAFDFDDLIVVPIQIFKTHPEILENYQARFQYLLVDEYQDTNPAQYELVRLLSQKHRNLCVVGDDDQSIYGWRGADIRNILDFEKDFAETRTFRLEQNYRSTRNILDAAHSVVSRNQGRKPKKLWSENDTGDKVLICEAEDERDEAYRLVDIIQKEVFRNKRTFKDFAVLYRTNAQSRAVEDALRRSGMAYLIVGGVRFYERKEVKDVLAYLKVVVNPKDTVSLKRIINYPTRGIGDVSVRRIEAWALEQGMDLFEALEKCDRAPALTARSTNSMQQFHTLMKKYADLSDTLRPDELVHTLIEESGVLASYKEDPSLEAQGRVDNIRELLAAVEQHVEETEAPSLAGFLEEVTLVNDVDQWNDKSNAITLMTLHSAKGLEFPVVLIPGMEEHLFPLSRSMEAREDLEEERRLFYVGITRAEEKLVLMYARTRRLYGHSGGDCRLPSRFIDEMEASVIEHEKLKIRHTPEFQRRPLRTIHDEDFSDPMPDYENESQEVSQWQSGQWVVHEMFGKGRIVAVQGRGAKQMLSVKFTNGMQKKFMAKYAKFKGMM